MTQTGKDNSNCATRILHLITTMLRYLNNEATENQVREAWAAFNECRGLTVGPEAYFRDTIRKIENINDIRRRRDDGEITEEEYQEQVEDLRHKSFEQGIEDKAFPPGDTDEYESLAKNYADAMKTIK